jgi:MFS family permease
VDRFGARPVAVGGLALAAVATVAIAGTTTGSQVIGLRLLWGVGEGLSIPALYQLTGTLGRASGRGETTAMGWFGSAAVVGMTAGPGLVAVLSGHLSFHQVFVLGGTLTALSALLVSVALPRVERPAGDDPGSPAAGNRPAARALVLAVLALGTLDLINNLIYAALEPVVPLYAVGDLGTGRRTVSAVFFAGLAVFALVAAISAPVIRRTGVRQALTGSFAVQVAALAVAWRAGGFVLFAAGFVVLMAVQPLVYVAVRARIAEVGGDRAGSAFGWFGTISDLGWIIGPLVATGVLEAAGAGVFLALAVLAAGAGLIALPAGRPSAVTEGDSASPP